MECFFLHIKANQRVFGDYSIIWKSAKTDPRGKGGGKQLQRFGSRALIYEVAGYGGYGTIDKVEWVKVYEFFNYLAFMRTINDKD